MPLQKLTILLNYLINLPRTILLEGLAFQDLIRERQKLLDRTLTIRTSIGVKIVAIKLDLKLKSLPSRRLIKILLLTTSHVSSPILDIIIIVTCLVILSLNLKKLPCQRGGELWNPVLVGHEFRLVTNVELVEILDVGVVSKKSQELKILLLRPLGLFLSLQSQLLG